MPEVSPEARRMDNKLDKSQRATLPRGENLFHEKPAGSRRKAPHQLAGKRSGSALAIWVLVVAASRVCRRRGVE
jgi:hypothetical protein